MKRLYYGGSIYTLDHKNTCYTAMGVTDDIITFLGTEDEGLKEATAYDDCIHLKGMTVLPGFNDSHMHLLNYGYSLTQVDISSCHSIDAIGQRIKDQLHNKAYDHEHWVIARGWNQDFLNEKRFPNRSDLDAISAHIPIVLTRVCGHICICNSAVIQMLPLGELQEDDTVSLSLGYFSENSLSLIHSLMPKPSSTEVAHMIQTAAAKLLASGITSVQSDDLCALPGYEPQEIIQIYQSLNEKGLLPIRVYQQCLFKDKPTFEAFVSRGYRTGQGDLHFKIGPLKLLLDGSLGGRTALLNAPYSDSLNQIGVSSMDQATLDDLVSYAIQESYQIAAHAIGDGALSMFHKALQNAGHLENSLRHGIVHAQVTSPALVDEMAQLGLMAYVQPIFLDYDLHIVKDRLGARAEYAYAFKTMSDKGLNVAFGTDAPVVQFNPFENIYCAMTRQDLATPPALPYLPHEGFTLMESLYAYTQKSAYCSFEEDLKGTLELGKLADFILLKKSPFEVSVEALKTLTVYATYVGGNLVYRAD